MTIPRSGSSRSRLARVSFVATAVAAATASFAPAASAQVIADHPRIYLTKQSLAAVQVSAKTDPAYAAMPGYMDRRIDKHAEALVMAKGNAGYLLVMTASLVGLVTKEKKYLDEAKSYLDAIASVPTDAKNDVLGTRNRLYAMAIGYDWLYAELDAAARKKAVDAITAYVVDLNAKYIADPNYVSGPSRWANVVALAGGIAVHGDDNRLDAIFASVLKNWREGYNPALDAIGVGGGHQMAWYYGVAYSGVEAYFMWKTAAAKDESWAAAYLKDVAYFPIYGTNGQYRLPVVEDSGADKIELGTFQHLAVSSGVYGNPHAEAFEQELEKIVQGPAPQPPATRAVIAEPTNFVIRVITRAGAPPPQPIASLPLSRFFSGSGFLVARDSWDRPAATTLVFKASPFYSIGHHQRDEGSLVVDFKGPLLVDAGSYDGGDGTIAERDHYRNFYTRTIAHNALLVRSPAEKSNVPNFDLDGGQEVRLSEARDLEDTQKTFKLTGIVGQADVGACVWSQADLGDTYDKVKMTSYTRDVLEVRRPGKATHPAIYVLDRTKLPTATPSAVLWQFGEAATVTGQRIDASNAGGGHVRLDVVRPKEAGFAAFSGDEKFKVAGKARLPAPADVKWPYWGRVEVSPKQDEAGSTWSTLIRVGESQAEFGAEIPSDLGATDWVGTRLGGTLFAIASKTTKALTLPAGAALADGCIAGLAANAVITVAVGTGPSVTLQANGDGVAVYDPSGTPPGPGGSGGSAGTGGAAGSAAGGKAGASAGGTGGASAGGNTAAAGTTASAGSTSTGGTTSSGGTSATGGANAGGAGATGGNASGGTTGAGGSDGKSGAAGGNGKGGQGGAGAPSAGATAEDDGGCGCRVGPAPSDEARGALWLVALGSLLARARRRSATSPR